MTSTEKPQDHNQQVAADSPGDIPGERPVLLDRLNVLVGQWEMEATFKGGFFGSGSPEITSRGRTSFHWREGRFCLTQRFVNEHPAVPSGITIIGTSEERNTFAQHHYDSRGVARVYQMALEGREWKLWREAPGFSQRFTGSFADSGDTIAGRWQLCVDDVNWNDDLQIVYRRH